MRQIKYTAKFKRDYKREKKSGHHQKTLDHDLRFIIDSLAKDIKLPTRNRDHQLSGNWSDHRDCHVKPDLVLIYRKPNEKTVELVRLGSHSELGL